MKSHYWEIKQSQCGPDITVLRIGKIRLATCYMNTCYIKNSTNNYIGKILLPSIKADLEIVGPTEESVKEQILEVVKSWFTEIGVRFSIKNTSDLTPFRKAEIK